MRRFAVLTALVATAAVLPVAPAAAAVSLIARGSLGGTTDLSGLRGTLENGLPANILGGLGSGLAYAGGNSFIAVPDRGPNANSYNPLVDDTTSYISRFQSLTLALSPNAAGSAMAFSLTATLTGTTLLYSADPLAYGSGAGLNLGSGAPSENRLGVNYFTGRSDNFAPGLSTAASNARLDPESVRLSNDGKSVFISDEYGPFVRQFDRATGQLIKTFALPGNLAVSNQSPQGAVEISGNAVGRVANKGMEGLAITPDGKTLVGIMQAALEQDAVATPSLLRIVTIDIATGATKEFAYKLTTGSGVSEILAINDHQFLVDERDGKGLGDGTDAKFKQIFKIDITGATDITALSGAASLPLAVTKTTTPFLDLVTALKANGLTAAQIPAKIEGIAFGQDVMVDGVLMHTLFVSNDNDFVPNIAGPNQFFVFGFLDSDLSGFTQQQFASAVPEPGSWSMMLAGFAAIGMTLRRRRRPAIAR